MSENDRRKWDEKYARRRPLDRVQPDEWLVHAVDTVFADERTVPDSSPAGAELGDATENVGAAETRAGRRALDVACGLGHNAIWLAERGWSVTGVDISTVGLHHARLAAARAGVAVQWVAADLDRWQPPAAQFELVAVFRFWDRAVVPRIARRALRPGGVLVLETFSRRQLSRPDTHIRNPAFCVDVTEVAELFRGFELVECRDVDLSDRSVVRILARRMADR